jgi:hypothetical protein
MAQKGLGAREIIDRRELSAYGYLLFFCLLKRRARPAGGR